MLLHVYRLRDRGVRRGRATVAGCGVQGDLRLEEVGSFGSRQAVARLFHPGTERQLVPALEAARVLRIRAAILIGGSEVLPTGERSVERYRQTWVCSLAPIPAEQWPEQIPGAATPTGFDPADDDE